MSQRLLDRIRDAILRGDYDLTRHAVEEMAEDDLIIFDVESSILECMDTNANTATAQYKNGE